MHHFSTSAIPYRVIVIACVWAASAIIFPPSQGHLVYPKFSLVDKSITPAIAPTRPGVCQDRLLFPWHPPAISPAHPGSLTHCSGGAMGAPTDPLPLRALPYPRGRGTRCLRLQW